MVCTSACTESFSLGLARRMDISVDMRVTIQQLGWRRGMTITKPSAHAATVNAAATYSPP
jgi:hypothetical protein